jgi:SPW repeat
MEVVGASGLNMLVGVWLIVSPSVLDYRPGDAAWNPVVFGSLVVVLAAIRAAGAWGARIPSWLNALIGAWLFVCAFLLSESQQATWNVGITGVLVFGLAIWSASATEGRRTVVSLSACRQRPWRPSDLGGQSTRVRGSPLDSAG